MRGKLWAATVHLSVTALVAGLLLWVLVRYWYPMPYFAADGGWQGMRLVVLVDLVLGPVLSLIVYDRAKPLRTLLLDYTAIAALQVFALGFGVWTVFQQRTAVVVFADGSLYTVGADKVEALGPAIAQHLDRVPSRPAYAAVDMTGDPERHQTLRREALRTGQPLFLRGELLRPLDCGALTGARTAGIDPWDESDGELTQEFRDQARQLVERHHLAADQLLFLPTVARYRDFTLVLKRDDCSVLDWLAQYRDPIPGPQATSSAAQ